MKSKYRQKIKFLFTISKWCQSISTYIIMGELAVAILLKIESLFRKIINAKQQWFSKSQNLQKFLADY